MCVLTGARIRVSKRFSIQNHARALSTHKIQMPTANKYLLALHLLFGTAAAWALSVATQYQVLCSRDYIAVATVISANVPMCQRFDLLGRCTTSIPWQYEVSITIDRLLAKKKASVSERKNSYLPSIGNSYKGIVKGILIPNIDLRFDAPSNAMSLISQHQYEEIQRGRDMTAETTIREYFVGKQFIFVFDLEDTESATFTSVVWPGGKEHENWVRNTLKRIAREPSWAQKSCARLH